MKTGFLKYIPRDEGMDIFNEFLCFGSNWGFMFVSSVKPSSYVHKSMKKSISMNSNETMKF